MRQNCGRHFFWTSRTRAFGPDRAACRRPVVRDSISSERPAAPASLHYTAPPSLSSAGVATPPRAHLAVTFLPPMTVGSVKGAPPPPPLPFGGGGGRRCKHLSTFLKVMDTVWAGRAMPTVKQRVVSLAETNGWPAGSHKGFEEFRPPTGGGLQGVGCSKSAMRDVYAKFARRL